MKLSEQQKKALVYIGDAPRKSGKFWRDLGIAPSTIASLETAGLVGAHYRPFDAARIIDRSWTITTAGRSILDGGREP